MYGGQDQGRGSANFWLWYAGKEAGRGLGTCPCIKNYRWVLKEKLSPVSLGSWTEKGGLLCAQSACLYYPCLLLWKGRASQPRNGPGVENNKVFYIFIPPEMWKCKVNWLWQFALRIGVVRVCITNKGREREVRNLPSMEREGSGVQSRIRCSSILN